MKPKESAQKKATAKKKQEQPKVIEVSSFDPIEKIEEQHNIIFKPNKGPQTEFLAAGEREVLYGGSAGGGSEAVVEGPGLRRPFLCPIRVEASRRKVQCRFRL